MLNDNTLDILVITSRPLVDDKDEPLRLLDVAHERRRLRDGLKRARVAVQVTFVPEATTNAVGMELGRKHWDVIHFTGHGTDDGRLVLEDGRGGAQLLSKQDTARLFPAEQAPLVLLSACFSETVGSALIAAGVPTVVAIDAQTPIADLAAIRFAEHFYAGLARGSSVALAVADARRAVALDPKVGDAQPPLDDAGRPETKKWSERFTLLGAGDRVLAASTGAYQEEGLPPHFDVPEPKPSFVGRAREIARVVREFEDGNARTVVLRGTGGLGKTELSKAVAQWYGERGRVEAALWASASRDEPEDSRLRDLPSLLRLAGQAWNLPFTEKTPLAEQKESMRGFLAEREASILLLDNWETLVETKTAQGVWDFVRGLPDTVHVLVTSRSALPPSEARNIELDPLADGDAVSLFVNIARGTDYFDLHPGARVTESALIYAICERLSGYPLALEVVGGLTASRPLGDIWDRLQQFPKEVLESVDENTGEPRGVWTSLDLSYDALPDAEKTLFRQMSVFLAPAAFADIAAILTEVPNARPVLDQLVRRSLVRLRDDGYALLPIVRQYAESKLEAAGPNLPELHERAANHYGQVGTQEGTLTASEHRFELATRFQSRDAAEAFRQFFYNTIAFMVTRGYWDVARRKSEQMIAIARALGDKQTEAEAIGELGVRYYQTGDYAEARRLTEQCRTTFEELGDKRGVASTLHNLAAIHQAQGDFVEARRLYGQSLKIKEELGDKSGVASTLHNLAAIHQAQGEYVEARRLYGQSLQIEEELGNKSGVASTLHELGRLSQAQGDFVEAWRLYEQSLKIKEELGDKSGVASTLHNLAAIHQAQGEYVEARRLYEQSRTTFEELGNKSGVASTLHQLAMLHQAQGEYVEARRLYEQCRTTFEELGDKSGVASTLGQLAMLHQAQGEYVEARRLYEQSRTTFEELGDKSRLASTLGQLGQLAGAEGQSKEALRHFLQALGLFEQLGSPYRTLARKEIIGVRDAVGEEQFAAWLKELTPDAEQVRELLAAQATKTTPDAD